MAPTAALALAAYLRKLGHNPQVAAHAVEGRQQIPLKARPDFLVVYSPWSAFSIVSSPVFKIRNNSRNAPP
jgi:hypothetical protein